MFLDTLDGIEDGDVQEQFVYTSRQGDLSEDEVATALDAYDRLARTTADADAILTNGGTAGVDILRKLDELGDADLKEAGEFLARSDVDTADAVGLLDNLPQDALEQFFRIDSPDWRDNLINLYEASENTDLLTEYVENLRQIYESNSITGEANLVEDFANAGSGGLRGAFRGDSGEAASAVRYLEDDATVKIEPLGGDYDLKITDSDKTEFVEVKTRGRSKDFNDRYVEDQIEEMVGKFNNNIDNSALESDGENSILELNIRGQRGSEADIRDTVESGLKRFRAQETDEPPISEIRVNTEGNTIDTPIVIGLAR